MSGGGWENGRTADSAVNTQKRRDAKQASKSRPHPRLSSYAQSNRLPLCKKVTTYDYRRAHLKSSSSASSTCGVEAFTKNPLKKLVRGMPWNIGGPKKR